MKNIKPLNIIELIAMCLILLGFMGSLIPFLYLTLLWVVIPLSVLALILSAISKNKTLVFTIIIFICSLLSWIPIMGYLFRIGAIVLAIISIVLLIKALK